MKFSIYLLYNMFSTFPKMLPPLITSSFSFAQLLKNTDNFQTETRSTGKLALKLY